MLSLPRSFFSWWDTASFDMGCVLLSLTRSITSITSCSESGCVGDSGPVRYFGTCLIVTSYGYDWLRLGGGGRGFRHYVRGIAPSQDFDFSIVGNDRGTGREGFDGFYIRQWGQCLSYCWCLVTIAGCFIGGVQRFPNKWVQDISHCWCPGSITHWDNLVRCGRVFLGQISFTFARTWTRWIYIVIWVMEQYKQIKIKFFMLRGCIKIEFLWLWGCRFKIRGARR